MCVSVFVPLKKYQLDTKTPLHGGLHPENCSALPLASLLHMCVCVCVYGQFLFFHSNVKFLMLDTGMYSPVILPAVPSGTLVPPKAIAQTHTDTQ